MNSEEVFFGDENLRRRMFSFLGEHPQPDAYQAIWKDGLVEVIKLIRVKKPSEVKGGEIEAQIGDEYVLFVIALVHRYTGVLEECVESHWPDEWRWSDKQRLH